MHTTKSRLFKLQILSSKYKALNSLISEKNQKLTNNIIEINRLESKTSNALCYDQLGLSFFDDELWQETGKELQGRTSVTKKVQTFLCYFFIHVCLVGSYGSMLLASVATAAPQVFNTPHYQSPVRASPNDLLVLPGAGFKPGATAIYKQVVGGVVPSPSPYPSTNTMQQGQLEVVQPVGTDRGSFNNAPDSLIVKLPKIMVNEQPYALWVVTKSNQGLEYSEPMMINDARPLWTSPGMVYETQQVGSTPRRLRVVGRNLERKHNWWWRFWNLPVRVRLVGPTNYTFYANAPDPELEHYVIDADLPSDLAVGQYKIQISLDWWTWHTIPENKLRVEADPVTKEIFAITDYADDEHPCDSDDNIDDTWCVRQALVDATLTGGGTVFFDDGQWDLIDPTQAMEPGFLGDHEEHGLLVPQNIDLVGTDRDLAKIVKHNTWVNKTVFTLMGGNEITNLHFDEEVISGSAPTVTSFFRLGNISDNPVPQPITSVDLIVLHNNRFTRMHSALGDGGWPIRDLHITHNEFQVYYTALFIQGWPNGYTRFNIEDAVITDNYFFPGDYVGSYRSDGVPNQGTLASQLGASQRMDFSRNITDGRENGGWRASHFWHMSGANEMLLVSENKGMCTSDKAGDGEFIAFDGNKDLPGFEGMNNVLKASSHKVTLDAPWRENNRNLYRDHWLVVVDGPGVGQARRIQKYSLDAHPRIHIHPNWDIVPKPGESKVVAVRAYWSTYIVGNWVDDSISVGCLKSNPKGKGGVIGWSGATFDSTIENNIQIEADGIKTQSSYAAVEYHNYIDEEGNPAQKYMGYKSTPIYASEIRGNHIKGEYVWNSGSSTPSSQGGIQMWYDAEPTSPNPVMGYNVSISHNEVYQSESEREGAITLRRSWYQPSVPGYELKASIIHNNLVSDAAYGVSIYDPGAWASTLYNNVDPTFSTPTTINDQGIFTYWFP